MESALDFIQVYQLWLTMNRYEFPVGEKAICVLPATARSAISALQIYAAKKGAAILSTNAMATIPAALSAIYPCPIQNR